MQSVLGDGLDMDDEEESGSKEDSKVESLSNQVISGITPEDKEDWRKDRLGGKAPESNFAHIESEELL